MNNYIKKFPNTPSFSQEGFDGYTSLLECENLSITREDVHKGHDRYAMNTTSYSIYYVIEGNGTFKIADGLYDVTKGDLIEIPPKTEFVFKGEMKMLLIMNPPFALENDVAGKENDLYLVKKAGK